VLYEGAVTSVEGAVTSVEGAVSCGEGTATCGGYRRQPKGAAVLV
jgi:hypothetical protein